MWVYLQQHLFSWFLNGSGDENAEPPFPITIGFARGSHLKGILVNRNVAWEVDRSKNFRFRFFLSSFPLRCQSSWKNHWKDLHCVISQPSGSGFNRVIPIKAIAVCTSGTLPVTSVAGSSVSRYCLETTQLPCCVCQHHPSIVFYFTAKWLVVK